MTTDQTAAATRKGLRLYVYRSDGTDCTNGGITAAAAQVTVTGIRRGGSRQAFTTRPVPRDMQIFPPAGHAPEVTLVIRKNGTGGHWVHLEPAADEPPGTGGYMDGGNYAATTDSRWTELTGHGLPLPVHDRTERA
jgi:hypothetical protein